MMCSDAELLLATYAVGSLDPADIECLRLHLGSCRHCRIEGELYLHAANMIAEAARPVAPPATLRTRLLAQVAAEAAQARLSTTTREDPSPWYRRLWARVPAARSLTLAGALSAVAAVVLAAWAFAGPHGTTSVVVRVAACGAAGSQNASCVLVYDRQARQSVLTVRGLAAPPIVAGVPVQTYEVWLVSGEGASTPAAILTERPGSEEWSAAVSADLSKNAAVAITAEPSRGSLTPNGPEVLRVPLPAGI